MKGKFDLLVIGGGAAGYFAAIRLAQLKPGAKVAILEKKQRTLEKVKVSGGGRCNVTHNWDNPSIASQYYPRGAEFLQPAFSKFHCNDMRLWLKEAGVDTKIESDQRVFPVSNDSQSIIDCFEFEVKKHDIQLFRSITISNFSCSTTECEVQTDQGMFKSRELLIATGSNRVIWEWLQKKGHHIMAPIASLFAFNAFDKSWADLAGVAVSDAVLQLDQAESKSRGPLLITHKGISGPAVLKLSAWAARELEKRNYRFAIRINWLGLDRKEILNELKRYRDEKPKMDPALSNFFKLPKRLNKRLFQETGIQVRKMAELGNKTLDLWTQMLCEYRFEVEGKATNKDEFVTCGGVDLGEVDPLSFQSKKIPNLYFAGEVLDIDAITGGFNFQACWSGANLVAENIAAES